MNILLAPFGGGGMGKGNGSRDAPALITDKLQLDATTVAVDEQHIGESHNAIEQATSKARLPALLIGGDHSITYPSVKGFSTQHKDFLFIVFDAHPDVMDDFVPPTQEDYLRALIDGGIVKPEQCILVGIRKSDPQEDAYMKEKGLTVYTAEDFQTKGIDIISQEITARCTKPIYLSLDIDAIDPIEAPGTGYPEPNGMISTDFIQLAHNIKATGNVQMIDLVEVNPEKDVEGKTVDLATGIVLELTF